MAEGSRPTGKGEGLRGGHEQIGIPVNPGADTAAEQLLPEIVAVRILRLGGMIASAGKGNRHAGREALGQLIRVKGPVSAAAGDGLPVQGHIRKHRAELPARTGLISSETTPGI